MLKGLAQRMQLIGTLSKPLLLFLGVGEILPTARVDWAGKRVAIIGNGSSAIQTLPQMQRTAKHIVAYIRNPTWISPSLETTKLEIGIPCRAVDEGSFERM